MRIQALSIVVGGPACNAGCPFCVSRMTGKQEVAGTDLRINVLNFETACHLARVGETTTVLLTGKGEPTLYPDQISEFMDLLYERGFRLVELQTNGIELGRLAEGDKADGRARLLDHLRLWRRRGLQVIAVSACHYEQGRNRTIYGPHYPDLEKLSHFLHVEGFTVRLCIMMQRGLIDSPAGVADTVAFCKKTGIEQLTVRPIRRPAVSASDAVARYVHERALTPEQEQTVTEWAVKAGTPLMALMHGAMVYDIQGQNVCLSDCLTRDTSAEQIRSLIFYPNGRLTYDWQYDGAVILGGW